MISMKESLEGGLTLNAMAVGAETHLIIPSPDIQYSSITTPTTATDPFNKVVRLTKADFTNKLAKVIAPSPVTSPPVGHTLTLMDNGVELRNFPIKYLPAGNTPNITPYPLELNITGSGSLKTAAVGTVTAAVVKHVGATTTAVNSNVVTRGLVKNTVGISQVTKQLSSRVPYTTVSQWLVKSSFDTEAMSVYNLDSKACAYSVSKDKESAPINIFRVGNPFGNYKYSDNSNINLNYNKTGNISAGVQIDIVVGYLWDTTWHIDPSSVKTATIDASGAVEISTSLNSDWYCQNNDTVLLLNGPTSKGTQQRVLYKLSTDSKWIVQNVLGQFTIANTPAAGTVTVGSGVVSVTTGDSIMTEVLVSGTDDHAMGAGLTLKVFNLTRGNNGVGQRGGYDVYDRVGGVKEIQWSAPPSGTQPEPRGDEFNVYGESVQIPITTDADSSATAYSMYIKLSSSTANGGVPAHDSKWYRVYNGPNPSFTWAGGGLTAMNPPTVNNTPTVPAGAVGYLEWSGSGNSVDIQVGQHLAVKAQGRYAFSIPALIIP